MMKNENPSKEQWVKKINELAEEVTRLKEKNAERIHTEEALFKCKANAYAFMNATSDLAFIKA